MKSGIYSIQAILKANYPDYMGSIYSKDIPQKN